MGVKEAVKRGHLIDDEYIDSLLNLAMDDSYEVAKESIETLYFVLDKNIRILEQCYEIAKKRINDSNAKVREASVLLMSKVLEHDPASNSLIAPIIVQRLDDEEVDVRVAATNALGIIAKTLNTSSEIVIDNLRKMAFDQDWRVRISVATTVKVVIDEVHLSTKEIIPLLMDLIQDTEESVREEASDTIIYLVDAEARYLKQFYDWVYQAVIRTKNQEIKASLVFLLSELTNRQPLQTAETILLISRLLSSENERLRTSVVKAYEKLVKRFEKKGSINPKLLTAINEALDSALFVANSSDPAMRRSAYEAIVHLIKYLDPHSKPYRKGRKAIIDALEKHEKDPQLRNYLEKAKILTTPLTSVY